MRKNFCFNFKILFIRIGRFYLYPLTRFMSYKYSKNVNLREQNEGRWKGQTEEGNNKEGKRGKIRQKYKPCVKSIITTTTITTCNNYYNYSYYKAYSYSYYSCCCCCCYQTTLDLELFDRLSCDQSLYQIWPKLNILRQSYWWFIKCS